MGRGNSTRDPPVTPTHRPPLPLPPRGPSGRWRRRGGRCCRSTGSTAARGSGATPPSSPASPTAGPERGREGGGGGGGGGRDHAPGPGSPRIGSRAGTRIRVLPPRTDRHCIHPLPPRGLERPSAGGGWRPLRRWLSKMLLEDLDPPFVVPTDEVPVFFVPIFPA